MRKIYLAGGFTDDWQERVVAALPGCQLLDPRSWQDPSPAIYTERDLAAIREADIVFVYMNSANPSGYGLSIEIGYAYGIGKPIVFCDHITKDWRSKYFGMARTMASAVFCEFEDCIAYIKNMQA